MFCEGVKVPVGGEGYDSHISVSLPIKEDKLFVSSRRCAAGRKNEFKRSLRLGMLGVWFTSVEASARTSDIRF